MNSGGYLYTAGTIDGNLVNSGTVDPDGPDAIGTITVNGSYTQNSAGTLEMEIASAKSFDLLKVSKSAALAGTIDVSLLNGYVPPSGTDFQLITVASSSGEFGTANLPSGMSIVYASKDVSVNS